MQEQRLNSLVLLYVHQDIEIDHDKILDVFDRQETPQKNETA